LNKAKFFCYNSHTVQSTQLLPCMLLLTRAWFIGRAMRLFCVGDTSFGGHILGK